MPEVFDKTEAGENLRFDRVKENWVHANGGKINGGVACVCAKWRVFVHFRAFLRFFVRFCAFFPAKMACRKARNCA